MNTPHIRTTHNYGEVYPNVFADFEWAKTHEAELLDQYGTCTILVYQQAVIGFGENEDAALKMAESNLPNDFDGEITPITYYLAKRHPFYRVIPAPKTDDDSQ